MAPLARRSDELVPNRAADPPGECSKCAWSLFPWVRSQHLSGPDLGMGFHRCNVHAAAWSTPPRSLRVRVAVCPLPGQRHLCKPGTTRGSNRLASRCHPPGTPSRPDLLSPDHRREAIRRHRGLRGLRGHTAIRHPDMGNPVSHLCTTRAHRRTRADRHRAWLEAVSRLHPGMRAARQRWPRRSSGRC